MSKSDISTKHLNLKLEKKDSKTIPKQVYSHIWFKRLYYTLLHIIDVNKYNLWVYIK